MKKQLSFQMPCDSSILIFSLLFDILEMHSINNSTEVASALLMSKAEGEKCLLSDSSLEAALTKKLSFFLNLLLHIN